MAKITAVLANNLKRLRKERGLTQAQLAEAVDVSLASIQNYESERIWPSIETVETLARVFKVDEMELFKDPDFKPDVSQALVEFARLLAGAQPLQVRHALEILSIGQQDEEQQLSRKTRKASS